MIRITDYDIENQFQFQLLLVAFIILVNIIVLLGNQFVLILYFLAMKHLTYYPFAPMNFFDFFSRLMRKIISVLAILLLITACAGRAPTPKSAQSLTRNFFKSYGKKYKTSFVGQAGIEKIEIYGVRERARHLAEIDAFLNLKNGQVARVLLSSKNTPPLGWKIVSWEVTDMR